MKDNLDYKEKKRQAQFIKELKTYQVNDEINLLDFLLKTLNKESRNTVKKILSSKCVLVNGLLVTQFDYPLVKKDLVYISKRPILNQEVVKTKETNHKENSKLDIIYEDDEFLVINKPAGLLSIESDNEKSKTAYQEALKYLMAKDKHNRCFQVHRLDKLTSGVLIFVKTLELKNLLIKNWNTLVKIREYYAVIEGKLDKKQDRIIKYIKKNQNNLMYDTHNEKLGEKAITNYEVIKENKKYSLVKCLIETGKKNQIRVTFNDLKHPILGDDKYGEADNPINRLCLHASKLKIKHPIKGNYLTFSTKIPNEFYKLLEAK